jgi:glycosyltransferase involved in cell wall biosynthesis
MKVSVIMPVYNGEKYIRDAILSLVDQSLKSIEIIIVDDHSSDRTPEIINIFARQESRIKVFRNSYTSGICYSLNKAISYASCELIARMDADDISHPYRLEKQLAFFYSYPETVLVGSNIELIDPNGKKIGQRSYPKTHIEILKALKDYPPFCHPSVMLRKSAVLKVGGYREKYRDAEDYDLWLRLSKAGNMANLQENLLKYRLHPGQISITRIRNQHRRHMEARREILGLNDHTILEKIKGKEYTLGRKYISLAYQQQQFGRFDLSLRFCFQALLHSPLSQHSWRILRNHIKRTRVYNHLLWYIKKLKLFHV